jgi:hypothetical protein
MNLSAFSKVLLGIAFLLLSCEHRPENLIINPGFEIGEGEDPEGWIITISNDVKSYQLSTDDSEARSGKQSYKISRLWTYPRKATSLKTEHPIPINPTKNYVMSFWYKTQGIDEYPLSFRTQFLIGSENTPPVRYEKKIFNSGKWHQYFILLDNIPHDALDLDLSFSSNVNTRGSIWLDDIVFREATKKDVYRFERWRRQAVPTIVGKAGSKNFKATGFYRIEQADDRWWVIDPKGNPTWLMATDGRGPVISLDNPETQLVAFSNTFGTTKDAVNEKMYNIFIQECGFNSFAGWTSDEFANITEKRHNDGQPYLPMVQVLRLAMAGEDTTVLARDRYGNYLAKGNHWVPDPFNPRWREMARQKAEEMIPRYWDKPWFFGWFIDNEIDYAELFRYVWAEYSSQVFLKMLREKYESIEVLNKTWTSPHKRCYYTSFEEILDDMPEPKDWEDPLWEDFSAFERIMIKEYIDFTYDLVKGLDPNHLVISNRLNLGPMPELHRTMDLWGKYDIVCMNIYPDNNMIGFNPGEIEIMKRLHEATQRPILIGEWSVPAIDSKLYEFGEDPLNRPLDWSWPQVLRTQKERGEAYEICIKQLASLDFVIGAGWYRTFDVDTDVRRANRGIMNSRNEMYRELTDAMKRTHADIKKTMEIKW